jgi:hypothetical protein
MPEINPAPGDNYERKVFQAFVEAGRLKAIPAKRKKREVLLRHMVQAFEERRVYREAEVNGILGEFHEDVATLRRELVEMGSSSATAANTHGPSSRNLLKHSEAPRRVGGLPVVAGWSLA